MNQYVTPPAHPVRARYPGEVISLNSRYGKVVRPLVYNSYVAPTPYELWYYNRRDIQSPAQAAAEYNEYLRSEILKNLY